MPRQRIGHATARTKRADEPHVRRLVRRAQLDQALGEHARIVPRPVRLGVIEQFAEREGETATQRFALAIEPGPEALAADVVGGAEEISAPSVDRGAVVTGGDVGLEGRRVDLHGIVGETQVRTVHLERGPEHLLEPEQRLSKRVPGTLVRPLTPEQRRQLFARHVAGRATGDEGEQHELLATPAEPFGIAGFQESQPPERDQLERRHGARACGSAG